jgi:hypothetical protein
MRDPFCPYCDVRLSLHGEVDEDDITDEDCEWASRKADILADFYRVVLS